MRIEKEESKLLKWVQKAAARDDTRPTMKRVCFGDDTVPERGHMVASDGFRMHTAQVKSQIKPGTYDVLLDGTWLELEPYNDGRYPDYEVVIPPDREGYVTLTLCAGYLRDAIAAAGAKDRVTLIIPPADGKLMIDRPVKILYSVADLAVAAIVMPMYPDRGQIPSWTPHKQS